MTEYEELNERITALEKNAKANGTDSDMIYNYIDSNMPEWAREAVQWCVDKNIIQGTGDGLGLNNIKLWVCVVLYRTAKVVARLVNVNM